MFLTWIDSVLAFSSHVKRYLQASSLNNKHLAEGKKRGGSKCVTGNNIIKKVEVTKKEVIKLFSIGTTWVHASAEVSSVLEGEFSITLKKESAVVIWGCSCARSPIRIAFHGSHALFSKSLPVFRGQSYGKRTYYYMHLNFIFRLIVNSPSWERFPEL